MLNYTAIKEKKKKKKGIKLSDVTVLFYIFKLVVKSFQCQLKNV